MKLLPIIVFVALLLACYGWGLALVRRRSIFDKDFAFLSVAGLAFLVFLGGILNLARLAYPAALYILLLSGLAFLVFHCSANVKMLLATWRVNGYAGPDKPRLMAVQALPAVILLAAVCSLAYPLLPAEVFNFDDDFQTYIPRPLRMLQTGTLLGNPFEVLGFDTLGGHAFLQGFAMLGLPAEYLLGFDAVWGFALAGLLLLAIARKLKVHWIHTTLALLGFIAINPQSVNVSALYIGSAVILGICFASLHLLDQMEKSGTGDIPIVAAGILGLLLAGLIALKYTFLSFALTYAAIFLAGVLMIADEKRKALKICGIIILGAFLALLPWFALHATNYLIAVREIFHPPAVAIDQGVRLPSGDIAQLFSTRITNYGGWFLSYGIMVLMLCAIGGHACFSILRNRTAPLQRGYSLVVAAACMAAVTTYLFNGFVASPAVALRYSCPVLIAALPFAWLSAAVAKPGELSQHPPKAQMILAMSMPLFAIIFLGGSFVARIKLAYAQHMTISFPVSKAYLRENRTLTSPETSRLIREAQNKTAPGQKILAWISVPGQLDFARNEIYSVRAQGLMNPWVNMPLNGNANDMIQFLRSQGIRYIMLQDMGYGRFEESYREFLVSPYGGYAQVGERALYFRKMLALITNEAPPVFYVDGVTLFDLQQ